MANTDPELLSDSFLSKGVKRQAQHHLNKAGQAFRRGAREQAIEHLRRKEDASGRLFTGEVYEPSELLTDDENKRLKQLTRRRFSVNPEGIIVGKRLPPDEMEDYMRLERKSIGEED